MARAIPGHWLISASLESALVAAWRLASNEWTCPFTSAPTRSRAGGFQDAVIGEPKRAPGGRRTFTGLWDNKLDVVLAAVLLDKDEVRAPPASIGFTFCTSARHGRFPERECIFDADLTATISDLWVRNVAQFIAGGGRVGARRADRLVPCPEDHNLDPSAQGTRHRGCFPPVPALKAKTYLACATSSAFAA
jgi:hypothetical protein